MIFSADIIKAIQGEKVVGNGTVQLIETPTRCQGVMISAPSASNTAGEANTGNILIGFSSEGNASGGFTLEPTNVAGILLPVSDASILYLTGFNAGDAVEYQILQ